MGTRSLIGTIIVRTGRTEYSSAKIGLMHRVNFVSHDKNYIQYGNYNAVAKKHYRRATKEEIEAYKKGIKDINLIRQTQKDEYSIF